ncbi:hypothetical protein PMNALOAF_1871 [Methylobacterium adhaesivum]|uniref:Uncharacterized protein n=1 Tax=Methylobacterium adhaesivum TaxID=333297 RepID=A0ABT8BCE0_9HYPH|nr:hypothetical protein [Methylobacterium adhaesivum]MDN3589606.1 hypothetical protein [Methylobacterium adhaesivum]GJD30623.1 hypothetical protein PMNALOAF_1871 [Methylobacterium adhaesivum]
MADRTNPTDAATRKPDDDVGTPGAPAVGGGGHTADQAAVTDMTPGGLTDAQRKADWKAGDAEQGRNPVPVGGSSDGQSDRKRH